MPITQREHARRLITQFKGDAYIYGVHCFEKLGEHARPLGSRAAVVASGFGKPWGPPLHEAVRKSLAGAGITAGDIIPGARPNAPREDVFRIVEALEEQAPDLVVAVGGGSTIDAAKAAVARLALAPDHPGLDEYFGSNQVTRLLADAGKRMLPVLAVQLASGSAAHLTKYSNITDEASAQKMLIVDDAIVPPRCLFDYAQTTTMSPEFTMDGALDGVSHCLEVFYGAPGEALNTIRPVALLGIELLIRHVKQACAEPEDLEAREALGLGTDLGGYAIMLGGTNGAHLTSFSLVDVLPHGRACALMNPYYTVFFAPAIEARLREVGEIYRAAGYTRRNLAGLHGRDLGIAVAEAMLNLSRDIGFPVTLDEVPGFSPEHIERALSAARDPRLAMKLQNMPVPLASDQVDDYMGPVLEAARTGDFELIRILTE
ncbi:MAG TPA: iron-containing alcohol dehydrogenase [Candidatus Hydrogenedentes bacterium]|nr:iron-containing alcohol dehydrogenase [Candidatus Hydrogenedentota bacterium]HPJ98739.1 iron-containing alcohol dehydrogenase [Candidatus Hydrogenedentota bacterium]